MLNFLRGRHPPVDLIDIPMLVISQQSSVLDRALAQRCLAALNPQILFNWVGRYRCSSSRPSQMFGCKMISNSIVTFHEVRSPTLFCRSLESLTPGHSSAFIKALDDQSMRALFKGFLLLCGFLPSILRIFLLLWDIFFC